VSDHCVDGSRLTVLLANHQTRKPLSSYVGEDTLFEQQDLCGERPLGLARAGKRPGPSALAAAGHLPMVSLTAMSTPPFRIRRTSVGSSAGPRLGVVIVTGGDPDAPKALDVGSFMSMSPQPPRVTLCPPRRRRAGWRPSRAAVTAPTSPGTDRTGSPRRAAWKVTASHVVTIRARLASEPMQADQRIRVPGRCSCQGH